MSNDNNQPEQTTEAVNDDPQQPAGQSNEPHPDTALAQQRLDDLQRLQAEYVNYKRRVDRDREQAHARTLGGFVESLLPVLDEIHLAREHGDLGEGTPFAKIADKLDAILARYGLERFGDAGDAFDPQHHEALMHVEGEVPEDAEGPTVVQVMQPGYKVGDKVVRPARVAVADPK
ncbi:nucleotide exchange factor GrpE [Calidifontibacter sp. DB0510]|uniref:Protein GrpE n=2 Tax=Metallococcus carri TaxID=1656884 RepID=A0A967B1I7_9MICO|nr:nucleotide exchange factor GrpE [Metallococcus carri]NOP39035.1 nucleotide exchange factor GrpE [Calidifontibacter sp. DB2511S]